MRQFLHFVFAFLIITITGCSKEQDLYPDYPQKPDGHISDLSDVLSDSEEKLLNDKLAEFEEKNSFQIFIFIGKTYGDTKLETYTGNLESKWKIGRDAQHGGLLIALFTENRESRIELDWHQSIPDYSSGNILHNTMRPYLDSNAFFDALDKGIDEIFKEVNDYIGVQDIDKELYEYRSKKEFYNDIKSYFTGELLDREFGLPVWLQIVSIILSMLLYFNLRKGHGWIQKTLKITFLILALIPVVGLTAFLIYYWLRAKSGYRYDNSYEPTSLWMNAKYDLFSAGSVSDSSGGSDYGGSDYSGGDYGGASDSWGDSGGDGGSGD